MKIALFSHAAVVVGERETELEMNRKKKSKGYQPSFGAFHEEIGH